MEESEVDFPVRRVSSLKTRDDRRVQRHSRNNSTSWVPGTTAGRQPLTPRGGLWIGGILMTALAAGSVVWGIPHVESQLERRALEELSEHGIETAGLAVDFSWRDGKLTGILPPNLSGGDIELALADVDGVRSIQVDIAVSEPPSPNSVPAPSAGLGPVSVIVQLQTNSITLNGIVLSEGHRQLLVEAATNAVGASNVDDRLQVSGLSEELEGADGRVKALAEVLDKIEVPTSGRIVLVDESLSSSLTVPSIASKLLLSEILVNSGLVGEQQIDVDSSVPEPTLAAEVAALQTELDQLQAEIAANVVFGTGDSALTTVAMGTLDKVVAAMERHQKPLVEVEGHTDSLGDSEANRQLSQARAEAVAAYLVSSGLNETRVAAIGYGQGRPIGDNTTLDGRQRNRRVQFTAVPEF